MGPLFFFTCTSLNLPKARRHSGACIPPQLSGNQPTDRAEQMATRETASRGRSRSPHSIKPRATRVSFALLPPFQVPRALSILGLMMMKLDPFPQKIARSSSYCHVQKLPSSGPPFLCLAPILTNFVHCGAREVGT